jgi:hypothetical protein
MMQRGLQPIKPQGAIRFVSFLILLLFIPTGCIVNDCRTLSSFKKVDDFPLYTMRYYGNYGMKDLQTGRGLNCLEQWGIKKLLPQSNNPQCACFAAMSPQADAVFGRNFDWNTEAALLLFTDPTDGYASVSMVDITYFGFNKNTKPGLLNKFALLFAPQIPFDGMNEYGLAVGIMSIPQSNGGNDPQKKTLGLMQLIRQMLDHAKNVDEAVALAQKYNIVFTYSPTNHIMVSDAAGNSAIIEYLDGTPAITRNTQPFQVATNFIVSGLDADQALQSCRRYKTAWQTLEQAQGELAPQQAMTLLNSISQKDFTVWSVVYGQSTGKIQLAMGRDYDKVYDFSLKMKDKKDTQTCIYPIRAEKTNDPHSAN